MRLLISVIMLCFSASAFASRPTFTKLLCRSYDYYKLGGDRKVVEIAITQDVPGVYKAAIAHVYETLLPSRQYQETERHIDADLVGLTCRQASLTDPKVITCSRALAEDYIGISRVERTAITSSFSSRPDEVIATATYEGELLAGGKSHEYSGFSPADCVLN